MSSINPVFERLISAERVHIWCQIPMKRVAGAMISIETVITLLPVMAAPCWNNIGKYRLGQEQWAYWPCMVTNMTNEDPINERYPAWQWTGRRCVIVQVALTGNHWLDNLEHKLEHKLKHKPAVHWSLKSNHVLSPITIVFLEIGSSTFGDMCHHIFLDK